MILVVFLVNKTFLKLKINVTNHQLKVDKQSNEIKQYESRLTLSKLGRISVDLDKKTYVGDVVFATMLQRDANELSGNLGQLTALIEHSDLFEFNKALEQFKRQPTSKLMSKANRLVWNLWCKTKANLRSKLVKHRAVKI